MNQEKKPSAADQVASFQKIWSDSLTKTMQAAFSGTSDKLPPEVLRQLRNGIFGDLTKSWDEFMRSPQFLEGTKHWMEATIAFRSLANEFMDRIHHELRSTSREDIDTIMLAMRHTEKRLLDRLEELSTQVNELQKADRALASRPRPGKRPKPANTRKAVAL